MHNKQVYSFSTNFIEKPFCCNNYCVLHMRYKQMPIILSEFNQNWHVNKF
jgi:hypothetical protein